MELINPDGSQRIPIRPEFPNFFSLSSCGDRYVVFDNHKDSNIQLWRADTDGSNPVKLAEDVFSSDCSQDGRWVWYANSQQDLYRIAIEGGPAKKVGHAFLAGRVVISPDAEWLAYAYQEGEPIAQLKIAICRPMEARQGSRSPRLEAPPLYCAGHPMGRECEYLMTRSGATNVWEQRLAGGEPRRNYKLQFRSNF